MEQPRRHRAPSASGDPRPVARSAASRLAASRTAELSARMASDEAAADAARLRLRGEQLRPIDPGPGIGPMLETDEVLLATRPGATLELREAATSSAATRCLQGDLCVTSRRLVLMGDACVAIGLEEIREVFVSAERLLLVLRDGRGAALQVEQPRLLRVEIAAARVAAQT